MIQIHNENITFDLQARTELATSKNGSQLQNINATVFTAFAAKDHTNASLQVELSENLDCKYCYLVEIITFHCYTMLLVFKYWTNWFVHDLTFRRIHINSKTIISLGFHRRVISDGTIEKKSLNSASQPITRTITKQTTTYNIESINRCPPLDIESIKFYLNSQIAMAGYGR